MNLGSRIREYRRRRGYTQREMAAKLNMTEANFSSYERNKSRPPLDTLTAIASILGVPVEVLLGKSESDDYPKEGQRVNQEAHADGYADTPSAAEVAFDELREYIYSLSEGTYQNRQFYPDVIKDIESGMDEIREMYDVDFEDTPQDILRICGEDDDAEFIKSFINVLQQAEYSRNLRLSNPLHLTPTEKDFLLLARHVERIPEEEREKLKNTIADTIDLYLSRINKRSR